ncbi:MAG: hypothetical protein AAGJ80_15675 [Cyanobacteria bacterium J06553_1]
MCDIALDVALAIARAHDSDKREKWLKRQMLNQSLESLIGPESRSVGSVCWLKPYS